MKKLLSILGAVLLIISFVGQAAAFFEDQKLIRTIYDSTTGQTTEIASDLGS